MEKYLLQMMVFETDLDLGHYERFIDINLNKYSNVTIWESLFTCTQERTSW